MRGARFRPVRISPRNAQPATRNKKGKQTRELGEKSFELYFQRISRIMAFTTRCLDLHFIRSDRQRVAAGLSQPQYRCHSPWPGAVCIRLQSRLFGHPYSVVILWCPTGSRVAAETGRQPRRYHRLFNLHPGIRCGFHSDHLCPLGSHHDSRAADRRFRYSLCCRSVRKSVQFQPASPGNHTGSQVSG